MQKQIKSELNFFKNNAVQVALSIMALTFIGVSVQAQESTPLNPGKPGASIDCPKGFHSGHHQYAAACSPDTIFVIAKIANCKYEDAGVGRKLRILIEQKLSGPVQIRVDALPSVDEQIVFFGERSQFSIPFKAELRPYSGSERYELNLNLNGTDIAQNLISKTTGKILISANCELTNEDTTGR